MDGLCHLVLFEGFLQHAPVDPPQAEACNTRDDWRDGLPE
jgi:hypothetical protein